MVATFTHTTLFNPKVSEPCQEVLCYYTRQNQKWKMRQMKGLSAFYPSVPVVNSKGWVVSGSEPLSGAAAAGTTSDVAAQVVRPE